MSVISVIIPVYNAEAFLPRCLDSLLAQSFPDWEALCVNDGSSDGSAALLEDYARRDPRFRVLHQENGGVSAARNHGLSQACGRYVLFVDSDDFLHPQAMELTLYAAERDCSALVAFTYDREDRARMIRCHLLQGREDAVRIPERRYDPASVDCLVTEDLLSLSTEASHPGRDIDPKWAVKHCQPWRCLYRRDCIREIPFVPGIIYEDFPWWCELLLRVRRASILNLPLYYYYPNRRSYIFASRDRYKIRSLRTALRVAEQLAATQATPQQLVLLEDRFLRPFRSKLASKERRDARKSALRRHWTRLRLLVEGHILNPLWDGEEKHRERRCKAFGRILTSYMRRTVLSAACRTPELDVIRQDGEEKIYTLWLQGEEQAPAIVKSCFASVRRHCSQELVVLDADSVLDYISLPEPILRKYREGKIKHCHFADICRVELLHEYGGYWLDATCYVTGAIPAFITGQDFFVYMAGSKVHGNYSYIQNCFIRARKGSWLLEAWRSMILEYWSFEDARVDYFQHQVMFRTLVQDNPRASALFASMPQIDQYPTHLYLYEYKDKPFDPAVLQRATREGFFYQKTSYRDLERIVPGSFAERIVRGEA